VSIPGQLRQFLPGLLLSLAATLGFVLASCRQAVDITRPPEIMYGQDVCDQCNMIISEEKYAAAFWTSDGQAHRFDDIGGMLEFHAAHVEEVASFWVHDWLSSEWISAEKAFFVMDSGVTTPMGYGIVAFAAREDADALAYGQSNSRVLTFDELTHISGGR